jgi:hypothetical protein
MTRLWLGLERATRSSSTPITLWAAVCCVDPTFPTTGPGSDERGRRRQWRHVPDQLTIVRAIRAVVSGCVTRKHVLARSLDGP